MKQMQIVALAIVPLLGACRAATDAGDAAPALDRRAPGAAAVSHPAGLVDSVVPLGGTPYGIAIAPSGKFVLTTQLTGTAVARAPLPSRTYATFIPVGSFPPHVAINPASTRAYVPNQLGHTVSVVDLATNAEITQLPLAGEGYNVAVHPNGATTYITTNIGRMYLLNNATNTFLDSVDLDPANNGLAFGKNNLLFVSSLLAGTVTAYNTVTRQVVRVLTTGGVPQRMAVHLATNELYIANETLGLDIWNLNTRTRILSIPMDAYGLGLSPDGMKLYVAGARTGTVTIVDRATRQVEATLVVGGIPRNVAFLPNGARAAVTNQAGYVTWIR